MRKIGFYLNQAANGLRGFRLVQAVVVVSFALALVMPCIAFSTIRGAIYNGSPYKAPHPEKTLAASAYMPSLELADRFEALFETETPIVKLTANTIGYAHIACPEGITKSLADGATMSRYPVRGVLPGYFDMMVTAPVTGRFFEEAEYAQASNVCVIGSGASRLYGADIGATLEINGIGYEVIGILGAPWMESSVTVPYGRYIDIQANNVQHQFLVEYAQEPDWDALRESFASKVGSVIEFGTVKAYNDLSRENAMTSHRELLLLALFTTLIAAVNVVFMLQGKTKCILRSVAVKYAIGARTLDLYWEMLCGNLLLFFLSIPLMLMIVEFAMRLKASPRSPLDAVVYIGVAGAGAALCAILSFVMLLNVKRLNIVGMMRKGK